MSKAFTRESDAPDQAARRRGLPVPEINVVTPAGLAAARAELDRLVRDGGDPDRIRELTEHLATAQAGAPPNDRGEVGLGARVTVEDDEGVQHVYEIVGVIEQEPKRGRLSWQSPLAQKLWGGRVGDAVVLPRGEGEIIAIEYP